MIKLTTEGARSAERAARRAAEEYKKAHERTVRRAKDDSVRDAWRELATRARTSQKNLRGAGRGRRVLGWHNKQEDAAGIWIGLRPIPFGVLGNFRETATGAKAGRQPVVPGAFIATMPNGYTSVFRRRDQLADADWLRVSRKRVRRVKRNNAWGSSVLPIVEEAVDLSDEAPEIEANLLAQVPERYRHIAEMEMRAAERRIQRQAERGK